MTKEINIRCKGSGTISIDNLVPFQGGLKTLTEDAYVRLKKEIIQTGFAFPFYVWIDKNKSYVVGGHQRLSVLLKMREEGYAIPPLPITQIEAKNREEAKRRILQDISQFGTVEPKGLFDFMQDAKISMEDLEISFKMPDLNIFQFRDEFFGPKEGEGDKNSKSHIVDQHLRRNPGNGEVDLSQYEKFEHECPRCKFQFNSPKAGAPSL